MTETNSKSRRQYWQERAAAARKKGGVTEDLIKEYMMDQQQQFLSVLEEIGMLGKLAICAKPFGRFAALWKAPCRKKMTSSFPRPLIIRWNTSSIRFSLPRNVKENALRRHRFPLVLATICGGGILMGLGKPEDAYKRFEQSLMWSPFPTPITIP